ncbi:HNH endonuclease [Pseudoclavibacter sp. 13-3]|uniref:HNH endonuclease n=1 Tax=Pseudoclavibacter sp. 13-3 TaxID=2901228 RepID=UPI001E436328|nr:HNH endonuclease signature motif containing protein [Pseudoclavibacter sp. 13-3]MCD7101629.1 HNH endonuclease [Pseudoclavibacter sp. 13-3]
MEATSHLAQPSQPDVLQGLIALGRVAGAVGAQAGNADAGAVGTGAAGSLWGGLSGAALVAAVELVEHAGRAIDSLRVQVAGEVAQRCTACDSDERLSTRYGQRNAVELIEYVAGVSSREARRRVRLGEQVLGRTGDIGLPLPPLFAQVGAALAAGDLGLEAAEAIVSELGKAAPRADLETLEAAECALVDGARSLRHADQAGLGSSSVAPSSAGPSGAGPSNAAGDNAADDGDRDLGYRHCVPGLSADLVRVQAAAWREALDPDGVQPREDEAVNRRDFWISSRARNGLHAVRGAIPADVAARALAVFDACLSTKTPPRFLSDVVDGTGATDSGLMGAEEISTDGSSAGKSSADSLDRETARAEMRTLGQQRADVFAAMVAALTGSPEFHTPPAVIVTIPAAASADTGSGAAPLGAAPLGAAPPGASGSGSASAGVAVTGNCCGIGAIAAAGSISGVDHPVAAQTIGRMACDGGTQFARLDARGALISLTTTQRVFSTHQRRAIAARDGHQCAIPGCRIPAHACEAHHVVPWQHGGATHVDNGVLLCWWHHRHIDNGSWQITMNVGRPQVRPPMIRSLLHQTARRRR